MPAAVLPFRSESAGATRATWSLLEIARFDHPVEPLGILLVNTATGLLTVRLRNAQNFGSLEEQEKDILAALTSDLKSKAQELGSEALLKNLEDSLSGFLRISERTAIEYSGDAGIIVDRLFDQHVASADRDETILPFITHLPLFGLRAAATKFGEDFEPGEINEPDAWLRVPEGLRLTEGMFVAQVVGRSMEPLISDGDYCVFRAPVTGTRQGRMLLIEQTGGPGADPSSRYTVKRYTSRKTENADGTWQHSRIVLEPLNKDFESFELGGEDFRVIAEFVRVLPH
jgi:SOS-response transcriptional repressor LexA